MKHRLIFSTAAIMALAACSQETVEDAETAAERAAADTAENAEVVGEELREGAIVASDAVADGAERMGEELREDEANDTDPSDGQLDGTD